MGGAGKMAKTMEKYRKMSVKAVSHSHRLAEKCNEIE